MSALYILIGTSLTVATGFLFAFLWATKKGQYDDNYTPSVRMLFDDLPAKETEQPTSLPKPKHTKTKKIKSNKLWK